MSKATFTPGPWRVEDDKGGRDLARRAGREMAGAQRDILAEPRGVLIATTNGEYPVNDIECGCGGDPLANAHLIAAAPALFAALKDLADFVEEQFRKAMAFTPRAELEQAVREHVLLAPARAALAAATSANGG